MKQSNERYWLSHQKPVKSIALTIGSLGGLASLFGLMVNPEQFFYSYLTAFVFWLSLGLGGLFFTMLHHLTGATWSVVFRRLFENLMALLPLMTLFFLPLVFGWNKEIRAEDAVLQGKSAYLSLTFIIARAVLYFVIWILLTHSLLRHSLHQDKEHSPGLITKMKRVSAGGMILFAFSLTFAAFDWLMSLDPHWYSTIFGVYYFAGSVLASLALVMLIAIWLRTRRQDYDFITPGHFADLGKMIFTFTVFWAYIAFSQYFLIWFANIPEETSWYHLRWHGSWQAVSMILVFGHFVLPFMTLITNVLKRNLAYLTFISFWLLLMHWLDLYWIVLPNYHSNTAHFSWMDFTCFAAIGGFCAWYFWQRATSNPVVPINDPRLKESSH